MTTSTTAPLTGRTAIVTASSRGIGAAIARRLGADGANVIVNYQRNADAAAEVVAAIEATGGKGVAVRADLSVAADIALLFDTARDTFGGLDILVNNAGLNLHKAVVDIEDEEFERVLAVNVRGTFLALRHAARQLRDGGRIVNISTGYTRVSFPGEGVYTATKAAVEHLGVALSKELGPRGITVNSVLPGLTDTDETAAIRDQFDTFAAMTPLRRVGRPEDIADVVAFLAGDDARWVTGQSIAAAGGLA
ncbi:SDR family oxidoreductase [Solihabitans fulvus]|nr:SDR family oxidoreductase [Solihabitans fulvus]